MNRRYHISKDTVLSAYMYSHHKSCGWKYCVLIEDAWKFMATLKECNVHTPEQQLSDYLIIECNTLEHAKTIAECIAYTTDKDDVATVWQDGRRVEV